jgi:DNA (cytosine-5)-methyltransferase 1
MKKSITAVDLFCGCGGLSLGLTQAGVKVSAAFDNWEPALSVYRHNIKGHEALKLDLSDSAKASKVILPHTPDVIVGGPPCQDFSQAGNRKEGSRASLTESFAEIVLAVKPLAFIMENVDRAEKSVSFASAKDMLSKGGFTLAHCVLDASKCGAPQKRKRLFCIGVKKSKYPKITSEMILSELNANVSSEPLSVKEYFKKNKLTKHLEGVKYYYRHPRNYSRRGIFSIDEPSATIRGVNRPVPSGYTGLIDPPGVSPKDVKPLSTKVRSMIQTFPESFEFNMPKTSAEQMIGNAVPVALAKHVALAVVRLLK